MGTDHTLAIAPRLEDAVLAAATGDAQAFGVLVDASRNTVTSIALAICGDVGTSEDISQDVYLLAWRRLGELRNPASFLPWIRQITRFTAKNRHRDRLTRERRLPAAKGEEALEDLLARVADPRPGAESRLLDHERLTTVSEILATLPDESREVVILFYREGRSTRQVASLLGLTDAVVRKRLERARRKVRTEALAHFAETARATAPTAAFTAAVLAATASAPSAAAAAMVGAAAGSAGPSTAGSKLLGAKLLTAKLLTPVLGAALGFLGGAAGVVLGLRRDFENALDARERRQLLALRNAALLSILLASALFLLPLGEHWIGPVTVYAGLVLTLGILYLGWLPRIVWRRELADAGGNREVAAARVRRKRRSAVVGWLVGALAGLLGLLIGLQAAGRLPAIW